MRADIHDGPEQMLQSEAGYIDARPLTASSAKPLATHGRTIHPGHSRHSNCALVTSGLPLKADVSRAHRHVSKVPTTDIGARPPTRPRGWRARGSERKLSRPACKIAGYSGRTPRCQLDMPSDYRSQPRSFSVRAFSALRMESRS